VRWARWEAARVPRPPRGGRYGAQCGVGGAVDPGLRVVGPWSRLLLWWVCTRAGLCPRRPIVYECVDQILYRISLFVYVYIVYRALLF